MSLIIYRLYTLLYNEICEDLIDKQFSVYFGKML